LTGACPAADKGKQTFMSPDIQPQSGTVKWYNRKKGFGFVTPDSGARDVFLHHSALPRYRQAQIDSGDRIAFHVREHPKGPSATQVAWLDGERPQPPLAAGASGFVGLGLNDDLLRAVGEVGYVEPTPIQWQAIPDVLNGRDLLGCAQTGTGKTAAFALPILQRLAKGANGRRPDNFKGYGRPRPIRALVLAPTRELAIQIADSFSAYGRYSGLSNTVIYGGVGQNPQVRALQRGVDILTATPGRLLDLIKQGYVKLDQVQTLVLDEADRMLDMGFIHDVRKIVALVADSRQTLLFSATMPKAIVQLAGSILRDPISVSVSPEQPAVEAIDQAVYFVSKKKKLALLKHLLEDENVSRALVFTRTKHGANRVVKSLVQAGLSAEPIHGNKSQTARQRSLMNFREGKTRTLVATDVVARGIDVEQISHVIQFDLPNEPESYVHRIGRTGRAGAGGVALALCSDEERPFLRDIEQLMRSRVPVAQSHPYQM
jgi:ATP-dependent RNA helicase RhlE